MVFTHKFFILSLILFFIVDAMARQPHLTEVFRSETGIIEISTALILCVGLFGSVQLYRVSSLRKLGVSWKCRVPIFVFILYEELSFFFGKSFHPLVNKYNNQNEFNLHNSIETFNPFLDGIKLPFFDEAIALSLSAIVLSIVTLFLTFGSRFHILKFASGIFLEQRFSIYFLLFIVNLIITQVLQILGFLTENQLILNMELVECFLYLVFLVDTFYKVKIYK